VNWLVGALRLLPSSSLYHSSVWDENIKEFRRTADGFATVSLSVDNMRIPSSMG
jgi:hypothetical protein